jgi:hypothetical protein
MVLECSEKVPFVVALWQGSSKPSSANDFLLNLVEELSELQMTGLIHREKRHSIKIANFVCDTPARSFIKMTKGHTGYSGCDNCSQSGEYIDNRMVFPEINAHERTDVAFDEMEDDEHHHGKSILSNLSLGMITQFPLDYMHLVCLGVMKRLIVNIWMKGPLDVRIGNASIMPWFSAKRICQKRKVSLRS